MTKHWHDLLWRLLMVSQKWSRVSWLQYGCCPYYIRGKRGLYFILLFYWEITNTQLKPQILNVEWDLMIIVTHVITIHPNTIENISSSQKVPTHPFPTKHPQFQTHAFWFPAKVNWPAIELHRSVICNRFSSVFGIIWGGWAVLCYFYFATNSYLLDVIFSRFIMVLYQ